MAPRRFRLAFQLRTAHGDADTPQAQGATAAAPDQGAAPRRRLEDALELLDWAFGKSRSEVRGREAKDLVRELERVLGERSAWTLETLRAVFDALVTTRKARRRSADHERVFWMLAGYCLRPGFGSARDPERLHALFPLFEERLAFGDQARGWQQFWIAWRRVAAGLGEPEQTLIRDHLDTLMAPTDKAKRAKGFRLEAVAELIELVSSLERVAGPRRAALGDWILERTWTDRDARLRTAIGRLGARVPVYASVHYVVAPRVAEQWLDHLLRENWRDNPASPAAAVQLARRTGDRARDISEALRREVSRKLAAIAAPEPWVRAVTEVVAVEAAERAKLLGDDLPVGLRLSTDGLMD